jgi:ABC-type molybdate transport system substrate-binding protein
VPGAALPSQAAATVTAKAFAALLAGVHAKAVLKDKGMETP